ncbi:MAG: alpha/beta hydrolase [Bacteroidales bacterium]|nr:alpha/beta hydrolase [Bacteroidales bacterium]
MDSKIENIDVLGNGFKNIKLPLPKDKNGEQFATLVYRNCEQQSTKSILYVHGFIDYFFQKEMADNFNKWGYNFYAVDLRKYGRSLLAHHHPNYIDNIHQYFEEIDLSISQMQKDGNKSISLMGHSTGGLTTALYTHHNNNIDALILNSPFFEINVPNFIKSLSPIVASIGSVFPYGEMNNLTSHYPESLHKDFKGEWDFNINWKPPTNFPTYFGWFKAIRRAQNELQAGLDIKCPVLVMYSDKSYKGKNWDDAIYTSDGVLDVNDISKYANIIGKDVTKIEIKDGVHDLVLSKKDVRNNVYDQIKSWLNNIN